RDVFDRAWDEMPDYLRANVEKEWTTFKHDACIRGNREQLEVAIQMLIQNALEAMAPKGGILGCQVHVQGEKVEVVVFDSGKGMSEETLQKCCEPFFTTKSQGTGLGLSTARTIVGNHYGEMKITSREGHGTTCIIQFPLSEVSLGG